MSKIDKNRWKKIVAASWHPGGVNAISPVIKRLTGDGKIDVVVIGHQFSENIFRSNGIGYRTIDFYGLRDVSVDSMARLLKVESPDLVLTGTSVQDDKNRDVIEQTITLAAKRMGIKSLAVLDLWQNYYQRVSDIYTGERFKFLPDKIAVMDGLAEEAMIKEGFDRQGLVITGSPHFDDLGRLVSEHTLERREIIRSEIGVPEFAYLVMYATDISADLKMLGAGFTDLDCLEILCLGITQLEEKKKKNVSLLLKKHPREKEKCFEELFRYASAFNITVTRSDYNPKLIALVSDLIVAPTSTLLIEATLMDRNALSLQPGCAKGDNFILNKLDLIPHAYDKEKGIELVKQIISGGDIIDYYKKRRRAFQVKPNATERVVEFIYKMLKEPN